jgi:hypothetical protein
MVKIKGAASDLVRAEFEDVEVTVEGDVTWLRTGPEDQAALFGLLGRIESLGLVLLEVNTAELPNGGTRS